MTPHDTRQLLLEAHQLLEGMAATVTRALLALHEKDQLRFGGRSG